MNFSSCSTTNGTLPNIASSSPAQHNKDAFERFKVSLREYDAFPEWENAALVPLMATIGVLIIVLNCYVFSLFARNRVLRCKTNIIPFNMTISDALVGFLVIPLFTVSDTRLDNSKMASLVPAMRLYHVSGVILQFSSLVAIFSLSLMIIDRAIAICFPFRHRRHVTGRRIVMVIISIWLLAAAFSSASFAIYKPLYQADRITDNASCKKLAKVVDGIVSAVKKYKYNDTFYALSLSGAALSLIALAITFCAIYCRRKVNKNQAASLFRKRKRDQVKAACLLSCMFTAVLVWLVPAASFQIKRNVNFKSYIAMYSGRFFISIFNPVLYTLFKQDIRAAANKDRHALMLSLSRNLCAKCRQG